jgi:hypothetical protein
VERGAARTPGVGVGVGVGSHSAWEARCGVAQPAPCSKLLELEHGVALRVGCAAAHLNTGPISNTRFRSAQIAICL